MAENFLYISLANPVRFYDPDRAVTDQFQTPHFDDFLPEERIYPWQQTKAFKRIWQTTDIIYLQFTSSFDPLIVELLDEYDNAKITLPALIGLPNKYYPNTFSFQIAMSLAGMTTGCYRLRITAGVAGPQQKLYFSGWMYISSTAIPNSILVEYWHSRFHQDILFETGIKFQVRMLAHFGLLKGNREIEAYRDQRRNPTILSSKYSRGFPVYFGDDTGLPDDEIDLLYFIWSCNNVRLDNKSFAAIANDFEFEEVGNGRYPRRGVKLQVEEGINRHSKIFMQETDTTKKLMYAINVEAKVWGDTSNQGSANTVPIITIE